MLIVWLHLSTNSVWIINFDGAKKNRLEKCLHHHSDWNLTASNFLMAAWLKRHDFWPVSLLRPIQSYIS